MITALESIVCAVSSVVERAAGPSCHRPPHVCILCNMARPQPGNMNEIHFCVCVSSEHAEVQTAYWLFKASGRWSRVGGRCCSAAQVWLWMSAGGALILLPWGETSLSGPDPLLTVRFFNFWLCTNRPFLTALPTQKHFNPDRLADTGSETAL